MKEIIEQYGKAIVTAVTVSIILTILGGLTLFGTTGIINIAGQQTNELADGDTEITDSASVLTLNAQASSAVPELIVKANPQATVAISLNDIFNVLNATEDVDLSVAEITTELNDPSTNAVGSLVTVDGKTLTFSQEGVYYLTVDIRQANRMMSQTFKITVNSAPQQTSSSGGVSFSSSKKDDVKITQGPLGWSVQNNTKGTSALIFTKDTSGKSLSTPIGVNTTGK